MNSINPDAWRQEWRGPHCNGSEIAVNDKSSGELIGSVRGATSDDVNAAAAAAGDARKTWAALPGPLRGDVIRRFAQLVLDYDQEIATQIVRETGSIRSKGLWEVHMTSREMLEAAMLGSQPRGVINASAEPGRHSVARRIPVGTIGIITPWNSPFLLGARAIGPALVAGNAVLLKPDPQTPICGGVIFAQLFEEAGLPTGLLQLLPGGAEIGEAISAAPQVDMISFTGSTRAGRAVAVQAGSLLKRVSLELGGNNPYIVLDDADIEQATSAGAWGSFFHQGQICLTAGRHIVHESIVDDYVQSLVRRAELLKVGDPFKGDVHLGPLINERQAVNVDRVIAESTARGAQLRTGGRRQGLFFAPTVLTGVTRGMPAFDEEIFGPVAPISTFRTDDEAVALANDTSYGLSSSVIGRDLARAGAVADRLRSGIVHVNDQPVLHDVYGPIGGVGVSGNGHNYSTLTNLDQFTEWQWMTTRTAPPAYPF
jgi:benzaldehyde dehydrogenase (NAD)